MDAKTTRCNQCLAVLPTPMTFRPLDLTHERWCAPCALKVAAKIVEMSPELAADLIRNASAILAKCSVAYHPGRAAVLPGERGI